MEDFSNVCTIVPRQKEEILSLFSRTFLTENAPIYAIYPTTPQTTNKLQVLSKNSLTFLSPLYQKKRKFSLKKSVCVPTHQRDAAHVCIERQTERKIYFSFLDVSPHTYILSLTLPLTQSLPLTLSLTLTPSPPS